ncbi:hypothetical protein H2200_003204 [Cladophialophora chaetospira]|uniref:DUF4045 domain-containing protein n=1 Tax=Cladophialophora chaetospira TaxID=386627 RepID=A0AA38XH03_9EURO|nr:hypothetical protein H2200_003204 [Cladophialophora chaetospira]
MDASNDGGESVDQFLARIASLSSKQTSDEAERSKRSEEELLQARKERQARRLERARSLSPSKTGPSPSLRPIGEAASKPNHSIEPPVSLTPPLHSRTLGRSGSTSPRPDRAAVTGLDFSRPLPSPPAHEEPSLPSPPANATALSRSGTLSWNQRPLSRGGALRSRPLSVASIPDLGPSTQVAGQPKAEEEISRKDIAASLGAKDPTWFRQTADRGIGSAAYRKNESDAETGPAFTSRGMKLPGMSKSVEGSSSKEEPEKATPPSSPPKSAFAFPSHLQQPSEADSTRPNTVPLVSSSPKKSPALDLPAFKPLDLNTSFAADNSGLGRTSSILSSSGRPPSPTKGLGGFVESAMMKRSDSVSKRWSVQANAGLKRGDSIASARPSHLSGMAGYTPGHGRASSKDARITRDGNSSPLSSSRPVSSHGEPIPITKGRSLPRPEDEQAASSEVMGSQDIQREEAQPAKTSPQNRPVTPPPLESVLSRSPSKTMDPRRWSPTKSSWLESALNKPPESPRAAKPETPAWRLSMQRAKQEQQLPHSTPSKEETSKPAIAPKPFQSPPRKDLSIFGKPDRPPTSGLARPDLEKKQSPLPSSDEVSTTKINQGMRDKQDEKPVIPSKRNITPVQGAPSSAKSEETESTTSARVKDATPEPGQGPASPKPKVDPKAPALKPKPQTPPKTDFRASLKSRQPASSGNNEAEPEFKAVFGKLKRTQTQNFVAPDVLKDNITMGKAALNATGGPQKTKRVDEFKESILQKKEAMKTGGAALGKRPEVTSPIEKAANQVPEALAKRMALQKAGSSAEKIETQKQADLLAKPALPASKPQRVSEKPTSISVANEPTTAGLRPGPIAEKLVPVKDNLPSFPERASNPSSTLVATKTSTPDSEISTPTPLKSVSEVPSQISQPKSETSALERTPSAEASFRAKLPDNSKLASRLNPALAGILSRSGSPRPSGDGPSNNGTTMQIRCTPQLSRESTNDGPAELTHMTKARAKGPKRRTPKTGSSSTEASKATTTTMSSSSAGASVPVVTSPEPMPEPKAVLPLRLSPTKPAVNKLSSVLPDARTEVAEVRRPLPIPPKMNVEKPKPLQIKQPLSTSEAKQQKSGSSVVHEFAAGPQAEAETKPRPPVASKSADLRKTSGSGVLSEASEIPPPLKPKKSADLRKVSNPGTASKPVEQPTALKPITPKKVEVRPDPPSLVSSPPESDGERKTNAISPPTASNLPLTPNKSKLNTPKAPKPDVDNSTKPRSVTPLKAKGLGLQLGSATRGVAAAPVLTPPPDSELAVARNTVSPRKTTSPTKVTPSIRPRLESFFGVLPQAGERAEFDTHAFLSAQNKPAEKSKTLGNQIWEVTGDGKRIPMTPQQEHILFEDSMHLCVHSVQLPSGSKVSEVYLWCGDEVSEAAVEDAQLFCRKIARENSAKLEVVKQGSESSEFFQALGGIVIVRRNKTSALYMLCGRRHLGHVAFDEVDLSADSLCTGLPFLISAKFGKLYLWKGKDSNPEDVGCARLIGMDLGLTGEIEEVSEGEEPSSFWESLSSRPGKRSASGTSGEQSGQLDGHAPRLYRVEHDRPKSSGGLGGFWGLRASSPPKQSLKALVEEVAPFSQKDLDGHNIHILDAYREVYVLIGKSAKKPAELVTAVQIAQELAVLSPSVQDRPLLPPCYVVIGDPPQHIKSMFRKWKPQRSTPQGEQLCVRVEEVVQQLEIPV